MLYMYFTERSARRHTMLALYKRSQRTVVVLTRFAQ